MNPRHTAQRPPGALGPAEGQSRPRCPHVRLRRSSRHRARLASVVVLSLVAALLSVSTPAGAGTAPAAIAGPAQCHGSACYVVVTFDLDSAGPAVVRAAGATRRIRVAAGESRRIVQFRRVDLAAPVRVTVEGTTISRRVRATALPVNRPNDRCATLDPRDIFLSEGPPTELDQAINLPAVGILRAAVLFIDFPDAAGPGNPTAVTERWMATEIEHLETSSYGRFGVDIIDTTEGWVRMPAPVVDYQLADGVTYDEHQRYIQDAIDVSDARVDFTDVQLVIVLVPDTAFLDGAQAYRGLPESLTTDEGLRNAAVTFGSFADDTAGVLFSHELVHTLGLPDLYAFSGAQHRYVGIWDFMGSIFDPPTDLFAWHRTSLGWLDPGQTLCARPSGTTQVRLTPLGATGGTKAVFVRTGPTTGLVVENRQPVANDVDICRAGALVYTVDSAVESGQGPIRVSGGNGTGQGCGNGPRSDAPLRVGESRTVGDVTVTVVGAARGTLEVVVAVR